MNKIGVILFFTFLSTSFYGNSLDDIELKKTIALISEKAPEVIINYFHEKLYLDESYFIDNDSGFSLANENGNTIRLPYLLSDLYGFYLPIKENKLFKLLCNHCKYEWPGGAFTFRCPRCRSPDFSIVPNW
ncbi:MAG: hypothetical protein WDZ28_04520 [Simkaniaceae bacterium]